MITRREFVLACGCTAACAAVSRSAQGKERIDMTAACGIDCSNCGIRKAANDPAEAEKEAARWRKRGRKDAKAEWFKCQGRHGDDALVWSQKCKIRQCCLKDMQLKNCSFCDRFPCDLITKFENDGNAHHKKAVANLRKLREKRESAKE